MWSRFSSSVPNAPCGVERNLRSLGFLLLVWFLMHRVELKAFWEGESSPRKRWFLMHRVELKVTLKEHNIANLTSKFLMHRVELKVHSLENQQVQRGGFLMHRVELKVC